MMVVQEFVEKLVSYTNSRERLAHLRKKFRLFTGPELDLIAEKLKDKIVDCLRSDTVKAVELGEFLLQFASYSGKDLHYAIGLRVKAQTLLIARGDIKAALPLYEQAIRIHRKNHDSLGEALVYLTSIWGLVNSGRYEEAVERGEWAAGVFREKGSLRDLGTLYNNLAAVHTHVGHYSRALETLDAACQTHQQMGADGEIGLPLVEGNRILPLCYSGRFQDAIAAGERAVELAEKHAQNAVKARNLHNLGITYLVQGQYTRAMQLFAQARQIHAAQEQLHEAALCDLSAVECLLLLRRFSEAQEKSQSISIVFQEMGMSQEDALNRLFQAYAFKETGRLTEAVALLEEARGLYLNNSWFTHAATCDLGVAVLLYRQGKLQAALEAAHSCSQMFGEFENDRVQSLLLIAEINMELGNEVESEGILVEVIKISEEKQWRWLAFQGYHLSGRLAWKKSDFKRAYQFFEHAIRTIEQLRGNIMVEYRSDFLEDKQKVYEDMISLCLDLGEVIQGLQFAERAKSRALLELLAFRPDLGIHALQKEDEATVEKIDQLRTLREERIRYGITLISQGHVDNQAQAVLVQQDIQDIEKQITDQWHQLLIKNADYARDSALWEVQIEDIQPFLPKETILVEYYSLNQQLICFLVFPPGHHGEKIQTIPLHVNSSVIEDLLQRFRVNLNMVSRSAPENIARLIVNAQGILRQLYHALMAPLRPYLDQFRHLIIVPHGPLHYLPFHALYDGSDYLIQSHQISYLPNASLLRYCQENHPKQDGVLVMGHSFGNRLPHAVKEADLIGKLWGIQPYLEARAHSQTFHAQASQAGLIHLACHGDFRLDNPLFSGVALEDTWLTTLDVFNLRLNASLVTLSACQTGRSIVGGGDELSGLMRAFLSAGAASLLLTHWPVNDVSTELLMANFYRVLLQGQTKKAALQSAQCGLLNDSDSKYHHPYFWAPFFLSGHSGLF